MGPYSKPLGLVASLSLSSLLLAGCGGELGNLGQVDPQSPGVYPPSAVMFGKTYGEWSAEWWKWVYAIPKDRNPLGDPTGERAGVGQPGPVWFLAGTTGNPPFAERAFSVPAGRAILVPILNTTYAIPMDGTTEAQIRAGAKAAMDHATVLWAAVDGRPLTGLWNYRFMSPFFEYTAPGPEDALWPDYAGTHMAVADGFYVMFEPLPPGPHTVQYRGEFVFPGSYPNSSTFETGVTYHLTVE